MDSVQLGELAQHLVPLRLRLVFVGVEAALAREAGGVEQRREVPGPLRGRLLREQAIVAQAEDLFQLLSKKRFLVEQRDQLGQADRSVQRAPQARLEPRARFELLLGAGDEGRADELTRFLKRNLSVCKLENGQGQRN